MNPAHFLDLAQQYRYLIIFPITVFEGPIIMVLTGFLVAQGILDFATAYAVLIVGDIFGDVMYYFLGRWIRHPLIWQWRHWFGLNDERIAWLEERFHGSAGRILVLGKVIHGAGSVILMGAGLTNVKFNRFIFYNIVGTIPKTLGLMLLGFFFGAAYQQIDHYLRIGAYLGAAILLIALSVGAFYIQRAPKQKVKKKLSKQTTV